MASERMNPRGRGPDTGEGESSRVLRIRADRDVLDRFCTLSSADRGELIRFALEFGPIKEND